MKKLTLLLFLIIPLLSFSQDEAKLPFDQDGRVVYSNVIEQTATKNELYLRAKEWFARTFKSSQDVIQFDDKETGKIIGKGFSSGSFRGQLGVTVPTDVYFTMSVATKDNKYKYEISAITAKFQAGNKLTIEEANEWVVKKKSGKAAAARLIVFLDGKANDLIKDLTDFMKQKSKMDEF